MKRVPAREYARRHKLSLFQVIKKIQNGELRGEQIEENGLKIQYVLLEETAQNGHSSTETEGATPPGRISGESPLSTASVVEELRQLRREVVQLRELLERCCFEKRGQESEERA
jgi:hypothetical protein